MTAFGLQTGFSLVMRIVYLALTPRDYRQIFAMEHGNSLLMFMDFLPELLKLTSWVTVLSYWRGLLSTDDLQNRQQTKAEVCRGPLWMGCAIVSTIIWIIAFILIFIVYGTKLKYAEVRLMEGVYLFIVSILLGMVGLFLIVRFLVFFKDLMTATQNSRQDEKGSTFMRLIRMRVTYATSISALAMVIYFTVLMSVAASDLPRADFLNFWNALIVLDAIVTLIVLWLLAPRTSAGASCCKRSKQKMNIPRGSSSFSGSRPTSEMSMQGPVSQIPATEADANL